jgi:competence protein ComEC
VKARVVRVRPGSDAVAADADPVPAWERTEEAVSGRPLEVDLALDAIEDVTPDRSTMVPVSGGVRVAVYGPAALVCGDRVELPLRLKPAQRRDG